MKRYLYLFFIIAFFFIFFLNPLKIYAADTVIRSFSNSSSDGRVPCAAECQLVQVGDVFYGMTEGGGSATSGTLFKINTDGTGFSILKSFGGGAGDGYAPLGYPTIDGSVIYGMTYGGGLSDWGIIFKINTDGTGFSVMHEFQGGSGDGNGPRGSLLQIGSTLYGMTSNGGDFAAGTVFKINTNGTGFSVIHEFTGDVDGGSQPYGNLIAIGSTLYGLTSRGGNDDIGTIFKINTDGAGFSLLREFQGGASDGSFPYGSLLYYSNKLYGLTQQGGTNNLGVMFQMNPNGTGFSILHNFAGVPTDGSSPDGSLIEYNGKLYGFGFDGGSSDKGTIFSYDVAGSTYTTLHSFSGATTDGQNSSGNLTFNTTNARLYGMTNYGGTNDLGTIFYYQTSELTPTPTFTPTPTPTQQSNSESGSNTSSSNSGAGVCNKESPSSAPNLFQINVDNQSAKLYFAPAGKPYNSYFISYGQGNNSEGYGVSFDFSQTNGVIDYKVLNLDPNSTYTFKVRAGNGCAPGSWSNNLTLKTSSLEHSSKTFYSTGVIKVKIDNMISKITKVFKKEPAVKIKQVTKKNIKIMPTQKKIEKPASKSLLQKIFNF